MKERESKVENRKVFGREIDDDDRHDEATNEGRELMIDRLYTWTEDREGGEEKQTERWEKERGWIRKKEIKWKNKERKKEKKQERKKNKE